MKRFGYLVLTAFVLTSCVSETTESGGSNQEPEPIVVPDPVTTPVTCDTLNCPHGCCDDKCVDLRSDPQHCGRCDTKCTNYCLNSQCMTSCSGEYARVCSMKCVDLSINADNCGGCDNKCGPNMQCSDALCQCIPGYSDCDGNAVNGCESSVDSCSCTNGETAACYWDDPATENIGICRSGVMFCEDGEFSFCENWVGPGNEIPFNGLDDDCDGVVDELIDADGDGYYFGLDDCCDSSEQCGAKEPEKINPGAHEVPGNGLDDNCNGLIDEDTTVLCSTKAEVFTSNEALTSEDAVLLAKAMDICHSAASDGYGLISAQLLLADGSPLPARGDSKVCGTSTLISPAEQAAVATDLGGIVRPIKGTMAVLSSGKAQGKENTGYRDCSGTEVSAPAEFLSAHNGVLPVSEACYDDSNPPSHKMANDSIMLRLKLKAPSNAKGFTFRFKFFSKEYPKFVCNNYNDFFLALTDAQSSEIPLDRNVSFDAKHNPVSVNNAFFTECEKSACKNSKGCSDCADGTDELKGYVADVNQAGATGWLKTSVPVSAGEEFTLDLMIFDAGDRGSKQNGWGHQRDSLVLLDNFEWNYDATSLITIIN